MRGIPQAHSHNRTTTYGAIAKGKGPPGRGVPQAYQPNSQTIYRTIVKRKGTDGYSELLGKLIRSKFAESSRTVLVLEPDRFGLS